jgi:hypothetical protein
MNRGRDSLNYVDLFIIQPTYNRLNAYARMQHTTADHPVGGQQPLPSSAVRFLAIERISTIP